MEIYRVTLTNLDARHKVRAVHLILSHTPGVRAVNRFDHLGHPIPGRDYHVQFVTEFRDGRTNTTAGHYVGTEDDGYAQIADWESGLADNPKNPPLVRTQSWRDVRS